MRDEVGVMIGRGMALGIDDSAAVVDRSMDSLVSSMRLDGTDWSKTGRLNVTTATSSSMNGGVVQNFNVKVVRADSDLAAASTILTRNALHAARGI